VLVGTGRIRLQSTPDEITTRSDGTMHVRQGEQIQASHDLNVGQMVKKADLYCNTRKDKLKDRNVRGRGEGVKTDNESRVVDTVDK
jgi:hypothetical protein